MFLVYWWGRSGYVWNIFLCREIYLLNIALKEGIVIMNQFNNWFVPNIFRIKVNMNTWLLYYVAYILILKNIKLINFYISFKLNFVSTTNFFSNVIIVRIIQTYRMYWYVFFCLCPVTYTFGYVVDICYFINFKLWMKYCECWNCDYMVLGTSLSNSILSRRPISSQM